MVTQDTPPCQPGQDAETEQALFALAAGQSRRLPRTDARLRIVLGCACVCVGGQEHILIPGDEIALSPDVEDSSITGLMKRPVIYQFL
jgi:hypothetical protein